MVTKAALLSRGLLYSYLYFPLPLEMFWVIESSVNGYK